MNAAVWPRTGPGAARLLVVDPASTRWRHRQMSDLPELLAPGDLLVVNDAAALPAALPARDAAGHALELRIAGGEPRRGFWMLVVGAGDWRTPTERRPSAPELALGEKLSVGELEAEVAAHCPLSPRLVRVRFAARGARLWEGLYAAGCPIQYAYLADDAPLEAFQTPYAARPWAAEMPSAGRPLRIETLLAARRRGVALASLTHAAGLSSTGDAALDAALPLPERYELPARTVEAVRRTRARGGRVVAVGTSVVRALEGAAAGGGLRPGSGVTDLRIGPGARLRQVDAILSGLHAPGESHFELLCAFAPAQLLRDSLADAARHHYLAHEFGDLMLVAQGGQGA